MMLFIVIVWILFIANAPWWIWVCFSFHLIGSFIIWIESGLDHLIDILNKLKK